MHRATLAAVTAAAVLVGGVALQDAPASSVSVSTAPISQTALTADPNLDNKVFNKLDITVPAGFDWAGASISLRRNPGNSGTVYNAPPGSDTKSHPNPLLWSIPQFSPQEFDTLVQAKNNRPADYLFRSALDGRGEQIGLGQNSLPPGSDPRAPNVFVSAEWFTAPRAPPDDGTFTIGRFTLSDDFNGTFIGITYANDVPFSAPVPFAGVIVDGVMIIPEPGGLGLLAGVGLLALRRRRA
jgi:hypothetical protein